jgi:cytochrome c5
VNSIVVASYRSIITRGLGLFVLAGVNIAVLAQTGVQGEVSYRNLLNQYCVSCHNQTLKTANVMLDVARVEDVGQDPALWEKVLTKLTLRAMPPVGMPVRPQEHEYAAFVSYLRDGLDRVAQQDFNPGRPTIHRLNRTEYANAVRDLLALQIDGAEFLPVDNVAEGFDNIAEVLAVSPMLMDQYMAAAARVSRLAVGPVSLMPEGKTYQVQDEFLQTDRMNEDLPFGSRGGIAFQHYFPVDGEYTLRVRLGRTTDGYIRGLRKENQLDIRLDQQRIKLFKVGGEVHGKSGPLFHNPIADYAGEADQVGYEFSADKDLEVRFPVKAGMHKVGVAFLKDRVRKTGIQTPELALPDIERYKGGDATVYNVVVTGPYNVQGAGDTPSRRKILTCTPVPAEDEICPRSILENLMHLAYRRPVTTEEVDSLLGLYRKGRELEGFEGGIELALQGLLAGPEFLFRIEQEPQGLKPGEVYPISDIDLASRLSFFLWSSLPDIELLTLAEQGQLRKPGVLRGQVERMMQDPRSEALIRNFGGQWLALRGIDLVDPQIAVFPEFDGELLYAMKKEIELWFAHMFRANESVTSMLTSDYTFVNERLARHYGIPDVTGSRFRQVRLDNPLRRGLLGKAGLLTITSYNNRTSPVVRGKWVLENILAMAPPPPPADAFQPELKLEDKSGKVLTMRESMEAHRTNPVCANCHKMMEPIGLALETFDAIGKFRTRYADANAEVDASGILFDGSAFNDTLGFQQQFLKYSDRFADTVTTKLFTYALGRGVQYYDKPVIREIVKNAAPENHTWLSLILGIVESKPFQYRRTQS